MYSNVYNGYKTYGSIIPYMKPLGQMDFRSLNFSDLRKVCFTLYNLPQGLRQHIVYFRFCHLTTVSGHVLLTNEFGSGEVLPPNVKKTTTFDQRFWISK